MNKTLLKKIFFVLSLFALSWLSWSTPDAMAQTSGGCSVSDVVMDPSGNVFNSYSSPYSVDVSARFWNCENTTIHFRVWAELGSGALDDVVVAGGTFAIGNNDLVEISHTIASFGEENCLLNGRSPQCQYYITFERTDIGPITLHSSEGVPLSTTRRDVIGYNCAGSCNDQMSSLASFPSTQQNLQSSYTLTLVNNDPTEGNIQGEGTYFVGSNVNVVASPVQGYYFSHWSENGQQISTNRAIKVLLDQDRTLTAFFTDQAPPLLSGGGTAGVGASGECEVGPVLFEPSGNLLFDYGNGWNGDTTLQWLTTNCYGKTLRFSVGAKSAISPVPIQVYTATQTFDDAFFGGAYDPEDDIVQFSSDLSLGGAPCDPNLFPSCQYFFETEDITDPNTLNVLYTSREDILRSTGRDVIGFECNGACGTNFTSSQFPSLLIDVLRKSYDLDITVIADNGNTPSSTAGVVNGIGSYPINSDVNVAAIPNPGFVFEKWVDELGGTYPAPRIFVTMTGNRSLEARFTSNILKQVSVAILPNAGLGSVVGDGAYPQGTRVELVAQPNPGSRVLAWRNDQGEVIGRAGSILVTADDDISLELEFEAFEEIGVGAVAGNNFYLVPCGDETKPSLDVDGDGILDSSAECTYNHIMIMISRIINFIFLLILPLAGVIAVVTGVLMLTSGGNASQREKTKKAFGNFIIGIIIVMIAWLLVATILRALGVKEAYSLLEVTGLL